MNDLLLLALVVMLMLVGSFFCSGVETALLTVNPVKVHELAQRPRAVAGARELEQIGRAHVWTPVTQ